MGSSEVHKFLHKWKSNAHWYLVISTWWLLSVLGALRKQRQEVLAFEVCLCAVSPELQGNATTLMSVCSSHVCLQGLSTWFAGWWSGPPFPGSDLFPGCGSASGWCQVIFCLCGRVLCVSVTVGSVLVFQSSFLTGQWHWGQNFLEIRSKHFQLPGSCISTKLLTSVTVIWRWPQATDKITGQQ